MGLLVLSKTKILDQLPSSVFKLLFSPWHALPKFCHTFSMPNTEIIMMASVSRKISPIATLMLSCRSIKTFLDCGSPIARHHVCINHGNICIVSAANSAQPSKMGWTWCVALVNRAKGTLYFFVKYAVSNGTTSGKLEWHQTRKHF